MLKGVNMPSYCREETFMYVIIHVYNEYTDNFRAKQRLLQCLATHANERCFEEENRKNTVFLIKVSFQDSEMREDLLNVEARSVLRPDTSKQESLESEVLPDPMEGEQTWPTEEELAEAEGYI